jgi:hypothetical protein
MLIEMGNQFFNDSGVARTAHHSTMDVTMDIGI